MLKPSVRDVAICRRCAEPGIHATDDDCIRALRTALDQTRRATAAGTSTCVVITQRDVTARRPAEDS